MIAETARRPVASCPLIPDNHWNGCCELIDACIAHHLPIKAASANVSESVVSLPGNAGSRHHLPRHTAVQHFTSQCLASRMTTCEIFQPASAFAG